MTMLEGFEVVLGVARRHRMSIKRLRSRNKTPKVARAKAEACRELIATDLSTPEIARLVGYTNHTSVLHWTCLKGAGRYRE